MKDRHTSIFSSHLYLLLLPALALGVCLTITPITQARAYDLPVLVLADDEDPDSVLGSSTIFRDFLSDLAHALNRTGVRLIDEQTLFAGQGWALQRERFPLRERLNTHISITEVGMAKGIRAAVLLRMTIFGRQLGGRNSVSVYVEGQIFSYPGIQPVDIMQLPPYEFMVRSGCTGRCVAEAARERFPDVAGTLARALALRLSHLLDGGEAEAGRSGPTTIAQDDPDYVPAFSPYTITLRNFRRGDTLAFIGVMVEEFPGYQNHDLISLDSTEAQYLYETSASRAKLLEWINILLNDMSLDEGDVTITFQGNDLTIEKSAPTATEQEFQ